MNYVCRLSLYKVEKKKNELISHFGIKFTFDFLVQENKLHILQLHM